MDTNSIVTWLIPAGPLLAFAIIILFIRKRPTASWLTAWAGIFTALALSWFIVFQYFGLYVGSLDGSVKFPKEPFVESSIPYLPIGDYFGDPVGYAFEENKDLPFADQEEAAAESGDKKEKAKADEFGSGTWFRLGVAVDPLSAIMLFMVPFAVSMIFIYSVGYHNWGQKNGTFLGIPNHGMQEPLIGRFFAMMSLFAGAMLILVVSDNLLFLFVGWEIMGFCSYSLIGFWYARTYDDPKRTPPRYASIKAFMTTRIADVVMLMGIVFFYRIFGTLDFTTALSGESIANAIADPAVGPLGIGIMALMIFTGTVGKSAQWPFHVWLPDAMEGPTPVSAVIHAAAMVSAGIYLLLRIFPLIAIALTAAPAFAWTIAFIGAFTALMAATIAVAQYDVKGVLAYSTISQLGFMVAALATGGYIPAAFHLITHAYFKALLFMCSGSVIHGMEHGAEHVHDHHSDPQDMRLMGGLREKMPITFWTFFIGGMALSGFPLITAGFWSKDEILAEAWFIWSKDGNPVGIFVFSMLAVAAFLTAFYTTRQLAMTFAGKPRSPLAEHAHESNGFMTFPLVMLSFFAIFAGFVGVPDNFLNTEKNTIFTNHFKGFVAPTIKEDVSFLYDLDIKALDASYATREISHVIAHEIETIPWSWIPIITSFVVALGGIALGWWMYARRPLEEGEEDPMIAILTPAVHNFLHNKWYWDELYETVFVKPTVFFSEVIVYEWIDRGLIDGIIHGVANVTYAIGGAMRTTEMAVFGDGIDRVVFWFRDLAKEFRTFQSGKVQEYALMSTLIAFVFSAFFILLRAGVLDSVVN